MAKGLADLRSIADAEGYIPSSSWTRELGGWTPEDRENLFQELDKHFGSEKMITGWDYDEGGLGSKSPVFTSRASAVPNLGPTGLGSGDWMPGMNYASPFAPKKEFEDVQRAYDLYMQDNGYGLKDKIAQGVARALGYVATAYAGPIPAVAYATADAAAQTAASQGAGTDFLKKAVPGAVLSYIGASGLSGAGEAASAATEGAATVADAAAMAGKMGGQAATDTVMMGTPTMTEIARAGLDQTLIGDIAKKAGLKTLMSSLSPAAAYKGGLGSESNSVSEGGSSVGSTGSGGDYSELVSGDMTGILRSSGLDDSMPTATGTRGGYYSDIIDELNRLRKKRGAF